MEKPVKKKMIFSLHPTSCSCLKNFDDPEYGICSFMASFTAVRVTVMSLYSTVIVKLSHKMRHLLSSCKIFHPTFPPIRCHWTLKETCYTLVIFTAHTKGFGNGIRLHPASCSAESQIGESLQNC